DGAGTLRWTKRLDGHGTIYQIDRLGRTSTAIVQYKDGVVGASEPADTDLTTRPVYDAAGPRLQTPVPAGATTERITQFAYDALGRITQVVAPNTGSILYAYDGRGARTKLTYPGTGAPVITYSYFDDGRLNQVTQVGGSPVTQDSYAYDAVGRLAQIATKDTT